MLYTWFEVDRNVHALCAAAHSSLDEWRRERLRELDVSFCRDVSNEALGLVADSCPGLRRLHLWGCTQASDTFLNGHGNHALQVLGRGEVVCEG